MAVYIFIMAIHTKFSPSLDFTCLFKWRWFKSMYNFILFIGTDKQKTKNNKKNPKKNQKQVEFEIITENFQRLLWMFLDAFIVLFHFMSYS